MTGRGVPDIQTAADRAFRAWGPVRSEAQRWDLSNDAAHFVGLMDSLTRIAVSVRLWDRRSATRDQPPTSNHLLDALTGVGSLVQQLGSDLGWQRVSRRPGPDGDTLAAALDGYWWARTTAGGLRRTAQLDGPHTAQTGVWAVHPRWLDAGPQPTSYATVLAGRPAVDLVRRVLAAFVIASTESFPEGPTRRDQHCSI